MDHNKLDLQKEDYISMPDLNSWIYLVEGGEKLSLVKGLRNFSVDYTD